MTVESPAGRDVERWTGGDPEALARRLEDGDRPLLIAGGAAHWPAVARWGPAYLSAALGPIEISYKTSTSNVHPDLRQEELPRMFARERGRFSHFLTLISSGAASERARYLFTGDEQFLMRRRSNETSIDPELAPLLLDIERPMLFDEARLHTVWAWFSGPGVRTWLHYDNNGCHNLNAQITGHKRCWLYPPEELARLHPFVLGGKNPAHNVSRIDVDRPAPDVAADFSAARVWTTPLAAGDLLFIPAWWFHSFMHLGEFNSNVNFWWKPARPRWNVVAARQALIDAAAATALDVRDADVAAVLRALDTAALQRPA